MSSAVKRAGLQKQQRTTVGQRWPLVVAVGVAVVSVTAVLGLVWWQYGRQPAGGGQKLTQDQALSALQDVGLAQLESAAAMNPDNPVAVFDLAEAYIHRERWAEALEWFTRYRAMDPANLHTQIDIGIASMNLGLYGQAEDTLLAVLVKDPTNVQVHYVLGFLYANTVIPSPALSDQHWDEVLRLATDSEFAAAVRTHRQQQQR